MSLIVWAAAAALAVLLVGILRLFGLVGAGYKAKVLCTGTFVSGRTMDPIADDQVSAESYWILRPVHAEIDVARRTVTASFMGLLTQQAVYRPGLGATLVGAAESRATPTAGDALARVSAVDASAMPPTIETLTPRAGDDGAANHSVRRDAPLASRDVRGARAVKGASAIERIVADAFLEPQPRRRRRTQAVVILQDGEVIAERYAPGFSADTPLPGWSMAKSVLSALVGMLVQEGRLRLDQRELLREWRHPDPRAAITLEDLLRMRSGLRFSEAYALPWSDVLHMLYRSRDTGGFAASRPLAHTPGSIWRYASGTSNILSLICRRIVGDVHYAAWPRTALFERLGMRSAILEPDASGTFVASSYAVATARDWARYGRLWLDKGNASGGHVLDPSWIEFSTTPTPQSPQGRYGAHWWLGLNPEIGGETEAAARIPRDSFFAIGHEAQTLSIIPSKRLVVVRLGASIHIDAWNQAQFIADICVA